MMGQKKGTATIIVKINMIKMTEGTLWMKETIFTTELKKKKKIVITEETTIDMTGIETTKTIFLMTEETTIDMTGIETTKTIFLKTEETTNDMTGTETTKMTGVETTQMDVRTIEDTRTTEDTILKIVETITMATIKIVDSRLNRRDEYEYSEDDSGYNSQNRDDGDNPYYDQDDSDYDRRHENYDQDDDDYDENVDDRREGRDYDEKDDRFEDQVAIEREFYARHPEGSRESGEHASRAFPTESTMRSTVDSTDSYVVQRPLAFRLRGPAEKSGSFESRDDTMRSSVETRDDSGYVASPPQAFRVHGHRATSPSERSEDFDHRRLLDELGISD